MRKKRLLSFALATALMVQMMVVSAPIALAVEVEEPYNAAEATSEEVLREIAATSWTINGTTIPLSGYENMSESYGYQQCWAFAQMVYTKIWGTSFTSIWKTSDDMLRNIDEGSDRAITTENTEKFLSFAPAGAVIRIQSEGLDGYDSGDGRMHSLILVDTDDEGCWLYDSGDYILLRYLTWSAFSTKYAASYKYFKYIKWPGAEAYEGEPVKPSDVKLSSDKTAYPLSSAVTFTATGDDAAYFTVTVKNSSGSTVYSNGGVSKNATWQPDDIGTYTAYATAYNGDYSTKSSEITISVYDGAPSTDPNLKIDNGAVMAGQSFTLSWNTVTNAVDYNLTIKNETQTVYDEIADKNTYSGSLPAGEYIATITASNPYGSVSSDVSISVTDTTYTGTVSDTVTWSLNTKTGLFALCGTGSANYYDESLSFEFMEWYDYVDYVKEVDIPDGITYLGNYLFWGFKNVTEYDIPESVTDIGGRTFYNNTSLSSITFPKKLRSIGTSAFQSCSSLEEVTLPYYLTSLGGFIFVNCSELSEVKVWCDIDVFKNPTSGVENLFNNCDDDLTIYFTSEDDGFWTTGCDWVAYGWAINISISILNYFYLNANGGIFADQNTDFEWIYYENDDDETIYAKKDYDYSWSYGEISTETFEELPVPYRDGFTFDGWYSEQYEGYLVTEDTNVMEEDLYGAKYYYAHWTANEYGVEFNTDIGTSESDEGTAEYWATYEDLPDATSDAAIASLQSIADGEDTVRAAFSTRSVFTTNDDGDAVQTSGYEFDGWYTAEYGGVEITEDSLVELDSTQQLYAHWIDRNVRIESANLNVTTDTLYYSINATADNLAANAIIKYYTDDDLYLGADIVVVDLAEANGTLSLDSDMEYTYCTMDLCDDALISYGNIAYVCDLANPEDTGVDMDGAVAYSANTVSADVTLDNLTQDATAIMAIYQEGRQIAVVTQAVPSGTTAIQLQKAIALENSTYEVKVFAIDAQDTRYILDEPITKELIVTN